MRHHPPHRPRAGIAIVSATVVGLAVAASAGCASSDTPYFAGSVDAAPGGVQDSTVADAAKDAGGGGQDGGSINLGFDAAPDAEASSALADATPEGASEGGGLDAPASDAMLDAGGADATGDGGGDGTADAAGDAASDGPPRDAAVSDAEGGAAAQHLLVLAVNGSGALSGAVFDGAAWGTASPIPGVATGDDLALAMVAGVAGVAAHGVGLVHGASGLLESTVWNGTSWSSLAQVNADTTQGRPAIVASGGTAHAVFWGTDYKYYYEAFTGGAWTAAPQAVIPAGLTSSTQPCGPTPPALAPLASGPSLLFVDGICSGTVNHLYGTDLVTGAWQVSKDLAPNPSVSASERPAVAALASGPELVTVFIEQGTSQLAWASRTAGTWSVPAALTNGLSNDPVALAPLAGSGAVLAFKGTDGTLYTSTFSGTAWTPPAPAFATNNPSIAATPALATGIGSAAAEMVYLDTTGALVHTRLSGTAWGGATPIAPGTTGFVHAAVAAP